MQELGSLTGLRYYYSMALEAFDFLAPLLERLFGRFGDAGEACITKYLCLCVCRAASAEPKRSNGQHIVYLQACLGAAWWQGASELTGMINDMANTTRSYSTAAKYHFQEAIKRCLLRSVMAAGTPHRPVLGADLQRCAGEPGPKAAAAIAQKKRTPTVESVLMPCAAGAGSMKLSFTVGTQLRCLVSTTVPV